MARRDSNRSILRIVPTPDGRVRDMPIITSKYAGKCRVCRAPIAIGDRVFWTRGTKGATCLKCHTGNSGSADSPPEKKPMPELPGDVKKGSDVGTQSGVKIWSIDWQDLRDSFVDRKENKRVFKRSHNQEQAKEYVKGDSWRGYTTENLERWIASGYQVTGLILGDPPVPIREKRKLFFSEDGDEFHYDLAMSGDDNYFSSWTKQESIPGLAIEVEIAMSANVSHEVLNAYASWVCRAIYALEENGVDCQVSLQISSRGTYGGDAARRTLIRVKKENEVSDFSYWSPMISPAALRGFGFHALALNSDAHDCDIAYGLGRPNGRNKWEVRFDKDRRVLEINCTSSSSYSFPEEDMTRQLHDALSETRKG